MKKKNDWLWWLIIIVLLCSATPLGLIALFIYLGKSNSKSKQKQIPEKTGTAARSNPDLEQIINDTVETVSSSVDDAMRSVSDAINSALNTRYPEAKYKVNIPPRKPAPKVQPVKAAPQAVKAAKKKSSRRQLRLYQLLKAFGIGIAGLLTICTAFSFVDRLPDLIHGAMSFWEMFRHIFPVTLFACIGAVAAIIGHFGAEKARRFERYQNLIQPERAALSVHALADALELRYNRVCDDLQEMIDRNYFDFAYLDRARGLLVLSPDSANLYDAPAAKSAQSGEAPADQENEMLLRIRAANNIIDDPDISAKIDEIETLTRKILKLLEQRPEKADSMHSFTGYYLPQTLKLTEAYARLEAQGVEGENITAAKQKITSALDMLADGYRQQLDQLFQDDVVDITADIAVMEQMLARDGLAAEELQPERRQ